MNDAVKVALRILGIDPGLRITGFGLVEKVGNRLAYLASGCIRTDATDSLPGRLGTIHAGVRELVASGLEVAEYTALQVKQAVVGNGHADKVQVQHMVRRLLSLSADPRPDAADALACAIAHAHGGQGLGVLTSRGLHVRNGRLIVGK